MTDLVAAEIIDRMKSAAGVEKDSELADKLNLSKQSINSSRSKNSVPGAWVPQAAKLFGVTTDWLFWGTGPMRQSEKGPTSDAANQQHSEIIENRPTALADSRPLMSTGPIRQGFKEPLAASANLQHAEIAEIDKKRIAAWRLFSEEVPPEKCPVCAKWEQRFEASEQERRDLTAENRKLWQDNATLREKCARLEERSHRFEHRKSHDDIPSAG